MKKSCMVLGALILLSGCSTTAQQPSVAEINAIEKKLTETCSQKGYRPGTKDHDTCIRLEQQALIQSDQTSAMYKQWALMGAATVPLMVLSDARLKRNIVNIGVLENGIGIYRFKYIWSDREYLGVMAQEVETRIPGAVKRNIFGILSVDYAQVGFEFKQLEY